jgi:hypothetical protein
MRVNSAFTGFLTKRLLVASRIAIVMLAVFFIAPAFTEYPDRALRAKQMNLNIRQIGHRLLLQARDSTSRVLPVTEIKKGMFRLRFENEFVFNHDSLMALSKSLLPKTQFPSGYTVTVLDCINGGIVYGFQLNNASPDILACSGRSEPAGCYTIEFTFPGFYDDVKEKKADVDQLTELVKGAPPEVSPKSGELKTTSLGYDIGQRSEEPKSVPVDPQAVNPKLKEFETTILGHPIVNVVFGGMLVLLGVTLLIGRFGRSFKPELIQNQVHDIKESVPDLPPLGKFFFNVKGQRLLLGAEVINLTDKEGKVLELLHRNFGALIPRETLMQEIWINEGVITGRSLDMFVSKLRKKLSGDPELRITNVHGKGYKLEIPGRSII